MRSTSITVALSCANAACAALAQAAAPAVRPFAAPDASGSAAGGTAGHMLQTLLALIVVLGLVFALAWFFRRLRTASSGAAASIEVIAQASLGTKERAVLLKVGETRVLVGVATGSVRTLHVLSAEQTAQLSPAAAATGESSAGAAMPSFAELLRRGLGAK